jgi:hypothetical protein
MGMNAQLHIPAALFLEKKPRYTFRRRQGAPRFGLDVTVIRNVFCFAGNRMELKYKTTTKKEKKREKQIWKAFSTE